MTADFVTVVTTVQEPTSCVKALVQKLHAAGGRAIVVGDRKGPASFPLPGTRFYSLDEQRTLPFRLARLLPEGTYARKNLGYLLACAEGVPRIYETDDDNEPREWWRSRTRQATVQPLAGRAWINVYRWFTGEHVWPRGFPLARVADPQCLPAPDGAEEMTVAAPIQQGLADVAPDVDAVWRMVFDRALSFQSAASVWLPPSSWCPFNSQNTWWWTEAFPLLYLPSHCTFRMTDIWRGFIAQRCLWAADSGLVFHAPDVVQQRNPHDLPRDFEDELPGILSAESLTGVLAATSLTPGLQSAGDNLRRCYRALVDAELHPREELPLVDAWLEDLSSLS